MAAHEEARPRRGNGLDRAPGLHVDHVDGAVLEVGAGQHCGAVPGEGDARAQVRHTGNGQVGDLAAHIQVHHLRAGALCAVALGAGGAQQMAVALVEEEIVQRLVQRRAAHVVEAGLGDGFTHFVVVHQAVVDGRSLRVIGNLPDLRYVLERHHKALARCGVVHGGSARCALAVQCGGLESLGQLKVGVEQHHRARQVVGGHDPAAVAAHRHVAHVQARAHLGHHGQVPQVVLGDPAIARAEEHVAPVGGELRPAMQGVAAGKAREHFKAVAVQHRDMVVPAFHHDKQVHRVGFPLRLVGQGLVRRGHGARCADVGIAPAGRGHHGLVDPARQCADLRLRQRGAKARHLCGGAAFGDDLERFGAAQALQAFGQQGRAHAAGALCAMATGAVLLV